jgi:hypothetical protein
MIKPITARALASMALREALPGKSDDDKIEMTMSSFRVMLEHMAALGMAAGREEGYSVAVRLAEDVKSPLYGVSSALDGLADSVDTLMQTIPTRADEVISEMIRCIMARVDAAADELDREVTTLRDRLSNHEGGAQ